MFATFLSTLALLSLPSQQPWTGDSHVLDPRTRDPGAEARSCVTRESAGGAYSFKKALDGAHSASNLAQQLRSRIDARGIEALPLATPAKGGPSSWKLRRRHRHGLPRGNAGAAGRGCANGSFAGGALLVALGSTSVATDDVTFFAVSSVPHQPGLFFQGDEQVNGGSGIPFGDGLRCAGGKVVRLEIAYAEPSGAARSTVPIAHWGGVSAGDVKRYQWCRDPHESPCEARFNLSNGIEIAWLP